MSGDEALSYGIECFFPYDGPHGRESVIDAARGAAALVRYMNNATSGGNGRRTLEWASTTDGVIGAVHALVANLDQLLDQLAVGMQRQIHEPTLYDDRRDRHAAEAALEVVGGLHEARQRNDALATALATVRESSSHLGNN